MIVQKNNKQDILDLIAPFLWDENVIKSLGESIIYKQNSEWLFNIKDDKVIGFCCFYKKSDFIFLNYCFIIEEERGKGNFKSLIEYFENKVEGLKVKLVATAMSRNIFQKFGFIETKNFTNYFKMEKQY